jgi:hypothetical protein
VQASRRKKYLHVCGIPEWLADFLLQNEDKRYNARCVVGSFSFFLFHSPPKERFPFYVKYFCMLYIYEERFPLSIWPEETARQSDVLYYSGQTTDRTCVYIGYFIGYTVEVLIAISKKIWIPPIFSNLFRPTLVARSHMVFKTAISHPKASVQSTTVEERATSETGKHLPPQVSPGFLVLQPISKGRTIVCVGFICRLAVTSQKCIDHLPSNQNS